MRYSLLKNIDINTQLIPVVKHISQDKINAFGVTTGSTGAVHVDPNFGKKMPFKSTLAHGFLTMAYVAEMMENNFGIDWINTGEIEVKFVGAAKPGDSLVTRGMIKEINNEENGRKRIFCNVEIINQNDETVLVGATSILKNI